MEAATPEPVESTDRLIQGLIAELDRLEDLLEDMEELRVFSRDEVERRMAEINARVDTLTNA
jgi:hypothetical protein